MTERESPQGAAAEEVPAPQLRLRATPPPVMRLSRKMLAGLALVTGAGVGGALIYALPSHHGAPSQTELYNAEHRATPDAVANMPRDYAHVPQLGAPLPGDLGRPILKAGGFNPSAEPVDPMQQRLVQEQEAALTSKLFVDAGVRAIEPPTSRQTNSSSTPQTAEAAVSSDPTATQNMQNQKLAFLNGPTDRRTVSDDRLENPASPYVVQAGAVIPAALITGLRSDLPGQVTAQVTERVYDSPTGHYLLIPQGARLIGQYDSQISFAQSRVQLVWTRLIFPNGKSIVLERQPGADAAGYSGLQDGVDNHWGTLFKAALLSTVLSVGAEAGTSNSENNLAQAIRMGASNSISQVGQQIVERNLNVQPTLTIRPGFPVRVVVNRDLPLAPYE